LKAQSKIICIWYYLSIDNIYWSIDFDWWHKTKWNYSPKNRHENEREIFKVTRDRFNYGLRFLHELSVLSVSWENESTPDKHVRVGVINRAHGAFGAFYDDYYSDHISFSVFVVVVDKRYSCINPFKIQGRHLDRALTMRRY